MKPLLAVVAIVSLAGLVLFSPRILTARAASNPGMRRVTTTSCVDRYNSLLEQAKSALAAGDRGSTVDLLQRAKELIPACPALKDRPSPVVTAI
jgi:hypothetical protein